MAHAYSVEDIPTKRNGQIIVGKVTTVPECVKEAFPNITKPINPYLPLDNNYHPSSPDDSLICKFCLKVMEEIDKVLTDPDIEDAVSRNLFYRANMFVFTIYKYLNAYLECPSYF